MTIALLAVGSRGDTQPFVALGLALERAGHPVRLAAQENFASFVEGHGLAFHRVPGDVAAIAQDPALAGALRADNPVRVVASFRRMRDLATQMQRALYDACEGADAVVYHPGAAIGYFAARSMSVPSVLASPFPMTPTAAYPALIADRGIPLGPWGNRLSHDLFERVLWGASRAPVAQFWKRTFGSEPSPFERPFPRQRTRRNPTIVSCSPHLFPRSGDWPEHVHMTGSWFLERDDAWTPDPALADFLAEGPPPVYVGFGSMAGGRRARERTQTVLEALDRAGARGVLATGWGGLAPSDRMPETVFLLESAPHGWLFPRMAAIVHHGGAGTTAAAVRAGVPSIVVPHANDQFAWGQRIHALGVGPASIASKRLTAPTLAAAIETARTEPIRRAAAALGAEVRAERGADVAARVILDALHVA